MAYQDAEMESLSDLVLVSKEGVEHRVHVAFLARYSGFFRKMFTSGVVGGTDKLKDLPVRMKMEDMSGSELKNLLDCIYAPEISSNVSLKNVKTLTEAARKYEMTELLAACGDFCMKKVELENTSVLDWYSFASEYDLQPFAGACQEYMTKNTKEVAAFVVGTSKEQLCNMPKSTIANMAWVFAKALAPPSHSRVAGRASFNFVPYETRPGRNVFENYD